MNNPDNSIIRKTETAIDDLANLWARRKGVCVIVALIIALPAGFSSFLKFRTIPKLNNQIVALQNQIKDKELESLALRTELSPFKTIALQKFASDDARAMKKLVEKISSFDLDLKLAAEKIKELESQSHLRITDLRDVVSIRPNGKVIRYNGHRSNPIMLFHDSSPLASDLSRIFTLMNKRNLSEAKNSIASLIKKEPHWPYSYYYLGLLTADLNDFEMAARKCSAFRKARLAEPEHLLFEIMSLTFLDQHDQAQELLLQLKQQLQEIKNMSDSIGHVPIMVVSKNSPPGLAAELEAIAKNMNLPLHKGNPWMMAGVRSEH